MTATKGRRWCIYHRAWERAPICEIDQLPNRLVGYSPPQAGKKGTHLWVCNLVKTHKVSVIVDGAPEAGR
jgi:hypothetical protein